MTWIKYNSKSLTSNSNYFKFPMHNILTKNEFDYLFLHTTLNREYKTQYPTTQLQTQQSGNNRFDSERPRNAS